MAQIEVISGVDRHRRWTLEEKQAHVARAPDFDTTFLKTIAYQ
jgi:hypothetical protein